MYSDVRSNSNQKSNVVTKTYKMEIAVLEHKLNEKKNRSSRYGNFLISPLKFPSSNSICNILIATIFKLR